ncbi:MAG: hypothetical protein LBL75_01185 [Rickettsiales bacterium]|jgi:acyl-ACP thioesterase|nr:hypothetical protein [Rickettsiales bacterium]
MDIKYSEKKTLKTYQTDMYGFMRPMMVMNELQALADTHAEKLGVGRTWCLENNVAWVVTHYLLDMPYLPREGDEIELETWPVSHDNLKAVRDFNVRDKDGNVIISATSQWILIDMETRRPVRIGDYLPKTWGENSVRALDLPFAKLPDFTPTEEDVLFAVRYDDIDVNKHVNNAVYIIWATESVGLDYREVHELRKLFVNFRKEIPAAPMNLQVEIAKTGLITRNKVKSGDTEFARVYCEWKKRYE